jgi:hypothetical protein
MAGGPLRTSGAKDKSVHPMVLARMSGTKDKSVHLVTLAYVWSER